MLEETNDASFDASTATGAVLVDFWAPWCGPCKALTPVLEEIAAERTDLSIVKLNVDDNPGTAGRFGVMSIPTLVLFDHGAEVARVVGAKSKAALLEALDQALR